MKTGFIGLGNMGRHMAMNILQNGHELILYARRPESLIPFAEKGCQCVESPAQCAAKADMIITMLPSSNEVKTVALGKNGILEGIRKGSIYIDMSTIAPAVSRELGEIFKENGCQMLDAPVTRGVSAAEEGTLTIYVGGTEETFKTALPILTCMGKEIIHMGANGAGSVTKLANNMLASTIAAASCEMIVYAVKQGVEPLKLCEALEAGSGSSRPLTTVVKNLSIHRKFDKSTFSAAYMIKDIRLCLENAQQINLPLFYPPLAHTLFEMLAAKGGGKYNYADIITIFEQYADIIVNCGEG